MNRQPAGRVRAALAGVLFLAAAGASAETKLLRFPDVHGDQVVFTYARRPLARAGRGRHRDRA